MQLIVISSPDYLAGEADLINRLFYAGLSCFHLRKPGSDARQVCSILRNIEPVFYDRIALHQHHEIANAFNITRLHYPEKLRHHTYSSTLISNRQNGYRLSTSIHDVKALKTLTAFEYAFISPVFDSLSKPGYLRAFCPDFTLTQTPEEPLLIALGGITTNRLKEVKDMGFNGAAVLGTIWNQPDQAINTFKQLQSTITAITKQQT